MDWTAAIIVMVLILVLGSAIALFWWNLAARIAPYEDELKPPPRGADRAEGGRELDDDREEQVVIVRKPQPPADRRE